MVIHNSQNLHASCFDKVFCCILSLTHHFFYLQTDWATFISSKYRFCRIWIKATSVFVSILPPFFQSRSTQCAIFCRFFLFIFLCLGLGRRSALVYSWFHIGIDWEVRLKRWLLSKTLRAWPGRDMVQAIIRRPRRLGFDPGQVHVRFVVNKVTIWLSPSEYFYFSLYEQFYQRSIFISILVLLSSQGQVGETWRPSNKSVLLKILCKHWTENNFHDRAWLLQQSAADCAHVKLGKRAHKIENKV